MRYLIFLFLILSGCRHPNHPNHMNCERHMVLLIGACNNDAWCSVEIEDGRIGGTAFPIPGHMFDVCDLRKE